MQESYPKEIQNRSCKPWKMASCLSPICIQQKAQVGISQGSVADGRHLAKCEGALKLCLIPGEALVGMGWQVQQQGWSKLEFMIRVWKGHWDTLYSSSSTLLYLVEVSSASSMCMNICILSVHCHPKRPLDLAELFTEIQPLTWLHVGPQCHDQDSVLMI